MINTACQLFGTWASCIYRHKRSLSHTHTGANIPSRHRRALLPWQ